MPLPLNRGAVASESGAGLRGELLVVRHDAAGEVLAVNAQDVLRVLAEGVHPQRQRVGQEGVAGSDPRAVVAGEPAVAAETVCAVTDEQGALGGAARLQADPLGNARLGLVRAQQRAGEVEAETTTDRRRVLRDVRLR